MDSNVANSSKLSVGTSLAAILAAVGVSLCCIGPLVLAILGLGGGALLLKFEPYRPYFIVLTLGILSAGFYFTYRKPKAVEGDGCGCPMPNINRWERRMLWIVSLFVLGLLVFPYFVPYLF